MTALLLDPHGDDAALFAAYTVLKAARDDEVFVSIVAPTVPDGEINEALFVLGARYATPNGMPWPDVIYAPAFHEDGHEGHNRVAEMAPYAWPDVPIISYETYAPRGQRTRTDNEVPYESWMIAKKLRALSCFVSQIEQESTRPWFTSLLDLREWTA